MHVYICIYIYICVHTYAWYMCIHVHVYECVSVYICIYTYTYIYAQANSSEKILIGDNQTDKQASKRASEQETTQRNEQTHKTHATTQLPKANRQTGPQTDSHPASWAGRQADRHKYSDLIVNITYVCVCVRARVWNDVSTCSGIKKPRNNGHGPWIKFPTEAGSRQRPYAWRFPWEFGNNFKTIELHIRFQVVGVVGSGSRAIIN